MTTISDYRTACAASWCLGGTIQDVGRDGNGPVLNLGRVSQVKVFFANPLSETDQSMMVRCNQSAFVDRHDIEATELMQCPVLGCDHVWCRKCQQTVERGGPEHSCDGTKELEHLVQEQGWKFCPSAPIRRLHT